MFDPDLIWAADWDGLYRFFVNGNPPLVLQLLALNTAFLIFFVVRNATAKYRMRRSTVYVVQGLLIAANAFLAFQENALRWVHRII